MILSTDRDPRMITIRRGGTLTDEHHQLLALWAAECAEHVAPSSPPSPRTTRDQLRPSPPRGRGRAARCR